MSPLSTGPYDVLARIRANRAPQPAGERCEMCAEQIADEHSARGECRRPPTDVRVPRLLSAVHRQPRAAALSGGARPLPGLPRLRAGPPRVGGTADPGRAGVLLPQLRHWTGPSRSIPVRPAPPSPNWTSTPGTRSPPPTPGWACWPTTSRPCWSGCPTTEVDPRSAECFLVPIDACYEFVGRLRMLWRGFDGGQEVRGSSTISSARSRRAAGRWRK